MKGGLKEFVAVYYHPEEDILVTKEGRDYNFYCESGMVTSIVIWLGAQQKKKDFKYIKELLELPK